MNPKAEPFVMKKPIDVANDEIKALKKTILGLKSEMVLLKSQLNPFGMIILKEWQKKRHGKEKW